ncbi:NAD(P)H-hydrate epimerase [Achromobacter sp.]|uniref:NAD(P)H-hydrate epimerase n=1 Tax=Achromobacter sp. TaxID=134375 RepID=UPI0028A7B7BC|nr:NAD(P)H-hydrate epimerase [Achromobacter sp.]
MPSYSVAQIRLAEQSALASGRALMPLAGAAAAAFVAARFPPSTSVLALAGPGNNGGDALEAASRLLAQGFDVLVVLPSGSDKLPSDAARAWTGWQAGGGRTLEAWPGDFAPDLVIDGLFGIGLNRPLDAAWQSLVDTVNDWQGPVLALDVPSGIDADTGSALGRPVRARWTLSFIAPCHGVTRPGAGRDAAGECHLATLGVAPPQADPTRE